MSRCVNLLALWAALVIAGSAAAQPPDRRLPDRLLVHEWGTFTTFLDEQGTALGGINTDDEPLPSFVHQLIQMPILPNRGVNQSLFAANIFSKGLPTNLPQVTVRLETPVTYFYLPQNRSEPLTLNVAATFKQGLLTQFYPPAAAEPLKVIRDLKDPMKLALLEKIDEKTTNTLYWNRLLIGGDKAGPETNMEVWNAPRRTQSDRVEAESGEAEKYLFYRGVGNFAGPVIAKRDESAKNFVISSHLNNAKTKPRDGNIGPMWLVNVRPDGVVAFRQVDAIRLPQSGSSASTMCRATFANSDFSAENFGKLYQEMHVALVADGLFDEEATAMLDTWKVAYFRNPGLRLFSLIPQSWTDEQLPLSISAPADVKRVMVARVELVSAEQRAALAIIKRQENCSSDWTKQAATSPNWKNFVAGESSGSDLGVPIPEDYLAYLSLGRFRNALVLTDFRQTKDPTLQRFIEAYQLSGFAWRE